MQLGRLGRQASTGPSRELPGRLVVAAGLTQLGQRLLGLQPGQPHPGAGIAGPLASPPASQGQQRWHGHQVDQGQRQRQQPDDARPGGQVDAPAGGGCRSDRWLSAGPGWSVGRPGGWSRWTVAAVTGLELPGPPPRPVFCAGGSRPGSRLRSVRRGPAWARRAPSRTGPGRPRARHEPGPP